MTMKRTKIMKRTTIWTKGLTTSLLFLSALTISSAALAMEPGRDRARIDLRHPDILLTQIVWQDRSELQTSRNRFQAAYIGGLEQSYGTLAKVSRSNLLNSPAARYFTRILTGRRGR